MLVASLSVGALSCGGLVLVDDDEAPVATQREPEPDACNQFSGAMRECCDAGCRRFGHGSESVCISAENDCASDPERCREGEVCVVIPTSGRGGCSYGYDYDAVGVCEPASSDAEG